MEFWRGVDDLRQIIQKYPKYTPIFVYYDEKIFQKSIDKVSGWRYYINKMNDKKRSQKMKRGK